MAANMMDKKKLQAMFLSTGWVRSLMEAFRRYFGVFLLAEFVVGFWVGVLGRIWVLVLESEVVVVVWDSESSFVDSLVLFSIVALSILGIVTD